MLKKTIITMILAAGCSLLQSTILGRVAIAGVIPDLSLIVIIFSANKNGPFLGEITGFFSGLIDDFISLSPLGFHSLYKTVIGFISGRTKGTILVDPILMPMIFILIGTFIKAIMVFILALIFDIAPGYMNVFTKFFWIELGYNTFLAPFLFALLRLIRPLRNDVRER
jgi:rod shape-determining protein MreD